VKRLLAGLLLVAGCASPRTDGRLIVSEPPVLNSGKEPLLDPTPLDLAIGRRTSFDWDPVTVELLLTEARDGFQLEMRVTRPGLGSSAEGPISAWLLQVDGGISTFSPGNHEIGSWVGCACQQDGTARLVVRASKADAAGVLLQMGDVLRYLSLK
jgi:hypothetical protein